MYIFRKPFKIFFLLTTCYVSMAWAQPPNPDCAEQKTDFSLEALLTGHSTGVQRKRNNEFTHTGKPNGIFYCNPLTLKGVALNYNALTLESKGELKLIKGEPKNGKIVEIPFYLHLRRKGKLITPWGGKNVIFSKVEISGILKAAQEGDELIVEPANEEDWPAKRIVKIGYKGGC
jgi:hypothetical protein